MNRLTEWAIRRMAVKKLKAFFAGMGTTKTSEFWFGWGGLAMKGITLASPAAAAIVSTVAEQVGFPSGDMMIATALTIAASRMTSKAAKAE